MDDFDLDALGDVDFEQIANNVESKSQEADAAANMEAEELRKNANVCEGGACTI